MTDPNGWVKNPPSVLVKVHGTSRDMINGKFGLVLQYAPDRQRYTVLLCESNDPVSLKADNLLACGMVEKAQAHLQMLRNNPEIQQQVQLVSQQVQQRTGLKPEYALALATVALIAGWYVLGFSRLVMLISAVIMVLLVIGPDIADGKDARTVMRAAPARWREVVRTQIPKIGSKIASNTILFNAFTVLLVAFVVYSVVASPAGRAARSANAASASRSLSIASEELIKHRYYELGFEDATNAKVFGASLAAAGAEVPVGAGTEIDDDPYAWKNLGSSSYDATPVPKKQSPFSLSTALAAYMVYRTLQPLAVNAEGKFDLALFRANLSTLEMWKLGLIGFSVYRLVSAFL